MKSESRKVMIFVIIGLVATAVVAGLVWRSGTPSTNSSGVQDVSAESPASSVSTTSTPSTFESTRTPEHTPDEGANIAAPQKDDPFLAPNAIEAAPSEVGPTAVHRPQNVGERSSLVRQSEPTVRAQQEDPFAESSPQGSPEPQPAPSPSQPTAPSEDAETSPQRPDSGSSTPPEDEDNQPWPTIPGLPTDIPLPLPTPPGQDSIQNKPSQPDEGSATPSSPTESEQEQMTLPQRGTESTPQGEAEPSTPSKQNQEPTEREHEEPEAGEPEPEPGEPEPHEQTLGKPAWPISSADLLSGSALIS